MWYFLHVVSFACVVISIEKEKKNKEKEVIPNLKTRTSYLGYGEQTHMYIKNMWISGYMDIIVVLLDGYLMEQITHGLQKNSTGFDRKPCRLQTENYDRQKIEIILTQFLSTRA